MSDLETLKALFEKRDIEFKIDDQTDVIILSVEGGYSGFVTEFLFDRMGELETVGAFE